MRIVCQKHVMHYKTIFLKTSTVLLKYVIIKDYEVKHSSVKLYDFQKIYSFINILDIKWYWLGVQDAVVLVAFSSLAQQRQFSGSKEAWSN